MKGQTEVTLRSIEVKESSPLRQYPKDLGYLRTTEIDSLPLTRVSKEGVNLCLIYTLREKMAQGRGK